MAKWISTERAMDCVYEAAAAELRSADYRTVQLLRRIRSRIVREQGIELPDDGDYFDEDGNEMSAPEIVDEALRMFERSF